MRFWKKRKDEDRLEEERKLMERRRKIMEKINVMRIREKLEGFYDLRAAASFYGCDIECIDEKGFTTASERDITTMLRFIPRFEAWKCEHEKDEIKDEVVISG